MRSTAFLRMGSMSGSLIAISVGAAVTEPAVFDHVIVAVVVTMAMSAVIAVSVVKTSGVKRTNFFISFFHSLQEDFSPFVADVITHLLDGLFPGLRLLPEIADRDRGLVDDEAKQSSRRHRSIDRRFCLVGRHCEIVGSL